MYKPVNVGAFGTENVADRWGGGYTRRLLRFSVIMSPVGAEGKLDYESGI